MRSSWVQRDEVSLYLSGILFWVVTTETPEALAAWWDSGEMPFPKGRGVKVI